MSKFQQRHYEAIAEVMQTLHSQVPDMEHRWTIHLATQSLAEMFQADNPLFQWSRFEAACLPGANVKARVR